MFPNPEYSNYLKSEAWRSFRNLYFSVYPKMCAVCHATQNIQLHHRQYDNYKSRKFKDYTPLCKFHHDDLTKIWRSNKNYLGMNLDQFTTAYIKQRKNNGRVQRRRS